MRTRKFAALLLSAAFLAVSACSAQTAEPPVTAASTSGTTTSAETSEAPETAETAEETAAETTEPETAAEETTAEETTAETEAATETETAETAEAAEAVTTTAAAATAATTTAAATTATTTTAATAAETTVTAAATTAETTAPAETTTAKTTEKTTAAKTTAKTAEKTTAAETTTAKETQGMETPQERKVIALTFDDGPNTTTTMQVLDVLEKYGIRASFFLIGNNINSESEKSVRRAYKMGCEIANHSKSHLSMDKLTEDQIIDEIEYVNEKVIEITGEAPRFFRPPYIAVNDTMFETIELPFISGYGANDWEDKVPAEKRAQMVIRQAKNGAIILLHDMAGNTKTVEALDIIIPELQSQGYEFVTISEVFSELGAKPEAHDGRIYSYALQTGVYG